MYIVVFATCAEDFVYQLAFAHRWVGFYMQLFANITQTSFIHFRNVETGVGLDGIVNGNTFVGCFEVNHVLAHFHSCGSVGIQTSFFQQLLGGFHHPEIIFVRHIKFQHRKFRIVGSVHPFISEVSGELIYPVKTTYNQSFQIQFICDTQVQWNIQCIVMRDEGFCRSATGNTLQYRCIHFQCSFLI